MTEKTAQAGSSWLQLFPFLPLSVPSCPEHSWGPNSYVPVYSQAADAELPHLLQTVLHIIKWSSATSSVLIFEAYNRYTLHRCCSSWGWHRVLPLQLEEGRWWWTSQSIAINVSVHGVALSVAVESSSGLEDKGCHLLFLLLPHLLTTHIHLLSKGLTVSELKC